MDARGAEQDGERRHVAPDLDGLGGELPGALGLVEHDALGEADQRRRERLRVPGAARGPHRGLEREPGEQRVAAEEVEVPLADERVGDRRGADPVVDLARGREVGERLLEPAEALVRPAAVDERPAVERREPDGLREADRLVERLERRRDVAPVDLERAARVPDPDLLERIPGLLREHERAVEGERGAVEVVAELGAHAGRGVGRRQGPRVAGDLGELERLRSPPRRSRATSPRW